MIRVFVVLVLLMALVACDKEPPPTAPAGKASDFGSFLGLLEPDTAFNIELVFLSDEFTALERQVIAEVAASWEYRLGDVPDYRLREDTDLFDCSEHYMTLERGRVIDDVLVYVAKLPTEQRLDESDFTSGAYAILVNRPALSQDRRPLPAAVCVAIGDWKDGPLGTHEHKAFVQGVFMGALNNMLDVLGDFAQDPVVDLPDDGTFDIELIFLDEFDPMEKEIMVEETAHWEKMLGDIPAYQFRYQSFLSNCGDHPIEIEKGRVVDDVIMYVTKLPKDAPLWVAGMAGVWQERTTPDRLPAVGCVMIGEWKSGPRGTNRHKAFIQDVFLHEMGHALGVGTGVVVYFEIPFSYG